MLRGWPKIGLVVPCHNEATRLPAVKVGDFLGKCPEVVICFVNDGSTDHTEQVLANRAGVKAGQVAVINLETNEGKAEAVRRGVRYLLSSGDFDCIVYWDADMATPLDEIPRFIQAFKDHPEIQFLCGSRIRRMGASIERLWYRHYFGRVVASAISIVLGLPFYDTQCGSKMLKSRLAGQLFEEPFITRWLFDVELVFRALKILGKKQAKLVIHELPLSNWRDIGRSNVSLFDGVRVPFHLLRILWRYRTKGMHT